MSIGEYFDKLPDWTLKHFICHVVDANGRSPAGGGWIVGGGWWVGGLRSGWDLTGDGRWAFVGSVRGILVIYMNTRPFSLPVGVPAPFPQHRLLPRTSDSSLSLSGHMCGTSKLQTKLNRTDPEGPPSGAHHGEWQISKVPMDICNRTESRVWAVCTLKKHVLLLG